MRLSKHFLPVLLISGLIYLGACKKDKVVNTDPEPDPDETVTAADRIKDTTLLYSRDIYLWNTQIPDNFTPRSYESPIEIMEAIRTYSKEPGFSKPVDKWSFAIDQASWDDVSGGISQDFGLDIFFHTAQDLRVKVVEKNSPAGKAGVKRGWQIVAINGNNGINTSNESIDFIIENVFYSASSDFTFKKPDGTTVDISLNGASYQTSPIILDSVYTVGSKKVGYLAYNSFLGDKNQIFAAFDRIFNRFSQEDIDDIVVDLRYNGGGYVDVQDKLANYLVPAAGNGGIMMKQEFNNLYSSEFNETTYFSKIGNLELSRIFFIVSGSTASASELLINNLDPFLDVKVVGPEASYGKPVGYFPIPVGDWYIFPVSFRSTNKDGKGNYFDGFIPDKLAADGLDKDWGDKNENLLATVFNYIDLGTFGYMREIPGTAVNESYKDSRVIQSNRKLDAPSFKGMVDERIKMR